MNDRNTPEGYFDRTRSYWVVIHNRLSTEACCCLRANGESPRENNNNKFSIISKENITGGLSLNVLDKHTKKPSLSIHNIQGGETIEGGDRHRAWRHLAGNVPFQNRRDRSFQNITPQRVRIQTTTTTHTRRHSCMR